MGTAYIRQSSADIITGADILAEPLNREFNAIRDAFDASAGHSHDGTTGESQKIDLATSITGVLAVVNGGVAGINNVAGTTAPTANEDSDDGYAVGSKWIDTTNDKVYICVDSTVASAVWLQVGNTTGWQPLDAELTALAGLTSAADSLPYFTGSGTASVATFTVAGRALLDDANAAAQLVTLGLTATAAELNVLDGITATLTELNYLSGASSAIQTQLNNKQTLDTELTALAGLTSAANKIPYFTGSGTASMLDFKDEDNMASDSATAIPSQQSVKAYVDAATSADAELSALAGLVSAADRLPYFTGSGTAALATFTSAARDLLDDASASAMRTTLGVAIGSNVQAYDAELAAIAGLTSAADSLPYFTGSGTASLTTFTSTARSLLDDASTSAMRTTLGLAIGTDVQAYDVDLGEIAALSNVAGDILYTNATPAWTRLAKGSDGEVLTLASGLPSWAAASSSGQPVPTSSTFAVGTVVNAYIPTSTSVAGGATIAGGSLRLTRINYGTDGSGFISAGSTLTGTWQNVTGVTVDGSNVNTSGGLFVRTV